MVEISLVAPETLLHIHRMDTAVRLDENMSRVLHVHPDLDAINLRNQLIVIDWQDSKDTPQETAGSLYACRINLAPKCSCQNKIEDVQQLPSSSP